MEIRNYTLIKEEYLDELGGTAYQFRHDKTGAELCYLSNSDDNKVFNITFRTPPVNDKGIPHILEHCVLNGSRKFPVKEPFVELIKGSLNTFINAMTSSDWTTFPVASRNEKDFMNLTDVYLDAVFYPNLRHDPFIMKQEGWHYEMTDPEGPVSFKGVVFNEMKGAYSQPERTLYRVGDRALYPDTIYANESGGFPAAIPDLSFEEFCDFHARYYHPSNSHIFFYGNGDIEKHLRFLDEEYLSHFEYREVDSSILPQKPFESIRRVEDVYPSADDGSEKAFLSMGFAQKPIESAEEYYGMELLTDLLVGSQAAPIRVALQEAGIGKDISGFLDTGRLQPELAIVAKDADASRAGEFESIIVGECRRVLAEGFDKKLMEGLFNSAEFALREGDTGSAPKGLLLLFKMLDSWNYGKDPTLLLKYNDAFKSLRRKASEGYFEQLIEERILNNPHAVFITLKPDSGMAARTQKAEEERLAAYKASLTKEECEALCAETRAFIERQGTPDSKEALATIPLLAREDLDTEAEQFPLTQEDSFYLYPTFTNGIAYTNFYFPLDALTAEELPYAALLATVLGDIATEKFSHTELDNELNIVTGDFSTDITVIDHTQKDSFRPFFTTSLRYLYGYGREALELVREILLTSRFEDTDRLEEIIAECRSGMESSVIGRGHASAMFRAMSKISEVYAIREKTAGIDFYLFLKDIEEHFEEKADEIAAGLRKVAGKLINREGLMVQLTAEESMIPAVKAEILELMSALPSFRQEKNLSVACVRSNDAVRISGQIQYVAKGGRFSLPYNGSMEVFGKVLSTDYLWTNIRVKGGAYGSMKLLTRNGLAGFASYRDPNLRESLAVYDRAAETMRNFSCDERELLKYIIGTVSDLSTPLSPSQKGGLAFRRLLNGSTPEYIQRCWDEVLETTEEDLRADAEVYAQAMQDAVICVIGSRDRLNAEQELFDCMIDFM